MVVKNQRFCLFCASIGAVSLTAGLIWLAVSIFAGGIADSFNAFSPWLVILVSALCFAVNSLILLRPVPAAVPFIADLAVSCGALYGVYRLLKIDSIAVLIIMIAAVMVSAMLGITWYAKGLREKYLVWEAEGALLFAAGGIALGVITETVSAWTVPLILTCGLAFFGSMASKHSGVREKKKHDTLKGSPASITAIAAGITAGVLAVSALIATVFGKAAISAIQWLKGALSWTVKYLGYIANWLFGGMKKVRIDGGEIDMGDVTVVEMGDANQYVGDFYSIMKVIGEVVMMLVAAAVIVAIVITLVKRISSSVIGGRSKAAVEMEKGLPFKERLRLTIARIRRSIKGKAVLRKHPDSVAALLVKLEGECSRSDDLRREDGETAKEFITRLTESPRFSGTKIKSILMSFADEVDCSCYSQSGDMLEISKNAEVMKALIKKLANNR